MRTYEAVAKTADEAIEEILAKTGVSIEDLEIEIDEANKGLFGFLKQKQVRVVAKVKNGAEIVEVETQVRESVKAPETAVEAEVTKESLKPVKEALPVQDGSGDEEADFEEDFDDSDFVDNEGVEIGDPNEIIKSFIGEIAACIREDLNVKVREGENVIDIDITGEELSVLIGRHGRTLEALRFLTSMMINKGRTKADLKRINLDVEGYRKKRDAQLERLARSVATKVIKSGGDQKLEPMNPYERRIIHSVLQRNKLVSTRSEGVEPERCVIVFKK